jgi:hypothetical protein
MIASVLVSKRRRDCLHQTRLHRTAGFAIRTVKRQTLAAKTRLIVIRSR